MPWYSPLPSAHPCVRALGSPASAGRQEGRRAGGRPGRPGGRPGRPGRRRGAVVHRRLRARPCWAARTGPGSRPAPAELFFAAAAAATTAAGTMKTSHPYVVARRGKVPRVSNSAKRERRNSPLARLRGLTPGLAMLRSVSHLRAQEFPDFEHLGAPRCPLLLERLVEYGWNSHMLRPNTGAQGPQFRPRKARGYGFTEFETETNSAVSTVYRQPLIFACSTRAPGAENRYPRFRVPSPRQGFWE